MERATSRNLYLVGLVLSIIGVILLVASAAGATAVTNADGTASLSGGNPILTLIGILVLLVASVVAFIGYIGALVKLAKLGQWTWFILLLIFSGITMLIYIFAGPTQPKAA